MNPRRDFQIVASSFDSKICLTPLSVQSLGIAGEQQGSFRCLLSSFVEVGTNCLLELESLGRELSRTSLERLSRFVAVTQCLQSCLLTCEGLLQGCKCFQRTALIQRAQQLRL